MYAKNVSLDLIFDTIISSFGFDLHFCASVVSAVFE